MNVNETIQTIATNLKKLRKQNKLTQEKLIEKIGEENISLRSYKTYENKNSMTLPSLDKLIILAEFYSCSLDYIILNKNCIYDDSFSKKDDLKRLAILIHSLVLRPEKDNNKHSPYFGRYMFYAFDPDVSLFMSKYEAKCAEMNMKFEYENKNVYRGKEDCFDIINEMSNINEDWSPTLERMNKILLESNVDPEEYWEIRNSTIEKNRKIYSYTKSNNK